MSHEGRETEDISLWHCLHDGSMEQLCSDLTARTMALVVDNPFHWEFNNLDPSTRYRINLAEVTAASALTFIPWPGGHTSLTAADYKLVVAESSKGRLQSVDWDETFRKLEPAGEFLISGASFSDAHSAALSLKLQGSVDATGDYYELRIEAKQAQFFVGENELSVGDFVKFGERYWQAFSNRSCPQDVQRESELTQDHV